MDLGWNLILEILLALGSALVLGLVCERIGFGAIIGYLASGAIVGPGGLALVNKTTAVQSMAEIGVALLLFTIGLEFSWRRLVRFGPAAWSGGLGATLGLIAIGTALTRALGYGLPVAVAIGCALSMGSTSVVLPVLKRRNELDSLHGRAALGILLLQDLALVPITLVVTFMRGGGGDVASKVIHALAMGVVLVAVLVVLTTVVVPKVLNERLVARNRELPIILAITTCIGATWGAHALGLSPAMGAFLAGLLLADCRFSDQIRADVFSLKTLFITIFFASVGLLVDMHWIAAHLWVVLGAAAAVLAVKALVTYICIRPFAIGIVESMAAALAISQVGEFSFVIVSVAVAGRPQYTDLFQMVVAVTFITLLVTPLLAGRAYRTSRRIAKRLFGARKLARSERRAHHAEGLKGHLVVIGYGAAGQAACEELEDARLPIVVVEINPRLIELAEQSGWRGVLGDGTQSAILERARVPFAGRVVVAVPDHIAGRIIISQCKTMAPHVPVVARSRYHVYAEELDMIGADVVVDEEATVGRTLGQAARPKPKDGTKLDLDPYHSLR